MTVDWGSAPEWLSGVGGTVAIAFAAVAARAALRANRQQTVQIERLEQQEARRAENDRRRQASAIAVWIMADPGGEPQVRMTNRSGVPIYRVSVFCRCGAETIRTRFAVVAPADDVIVMTRATWRLNTVLTRQGVRGPMQWYTLFGAGELTVSMSFRDSGGVWWARSAYGNLTPFATQQDANTSLGTLDEPETGT